MRVFGFDHVHFYVENLYKWQEWFQRCLNFLPLCHQNDRHSDRHTDTISLSHGNLLIHISSPQNQHSSIAKYLQKHPEGLAEIGFISESELAPITINNIRHKFSKNSHKLRSNGALNDSLFTGFDHIVVNVPAGEMLSTGQWYSDQLGLVCGDRFDIQTEHSGLASIVMHNHDRSVQIPINKPTSANSQIQEFLDLHGGAGVQHLALRTDDISQTVQQLTDRGVEFLRTEPPILVEQQNLQGQVLLQIFTKPLFREPTFFLEIIERRQSASGFGAGNFHNLFVAVEKAQRQRRCV